MSAGVPDTGARTGRVGLIDVGSNAVRTRVVEVDGAGVATTLHDERTAIRVGREVFVSGALTPETIASVAEALGRFRGVCDRLDVAAVLAVATSAARSAYNSADLLRAVRAAGIDLQIIDGEREAALLRAAVGRRVDLSRGCNVLIDLGAGSLEVVVLDNAAQVSSGSHALGSLRLIELLAGDTALGQPLIDAIDALVAAHTHAVEAQLRGVRADRLLAIGSSIDVVADLEAAAGRTTTVDGVDAVPAAALLQWRTQMAALPAAERTRQFGITSDRADLVVVSLSIFAWLLRNLTVDAVLVPRVSLRDGLLAEWLAGQG